MIRCSLCFSLSIFTAMAYGDVQGQETPFRFFTEEYAPFSFSENDSVRGINTELLQLTATELGLEIKFAVVPWGRAQLDTQNNANTCFFSAARTQERENIYQWVGPLTRERIVLYSLNPDYPELETLRDARNYQVGGQIADAYSDWVEAQGVPVEPVMEVASNLEKLQWERIDLWLAGSIAGPYMAAQRDLEVHPQIASDEVFELWLACNPDFPAHLIQKLNETVNTFKHDGTLEAIRERYQ